MHNAHQSSIAPSFVALVKYDLILTAIGVARHTATGQINDAPRVAQLSLVLAAGGHRLLLEHGGCR